MEIEWITIGEAVALSNKSEQTIRRWVKSNVNDSSHVTNKPGNIRINKAKLAKSFILKNDQQSTNKMEEAKHHKDAVIAATSAKSVDSITLQLQAKDKQIAKLINKKSKNSIWLTLIFLGITLVLLMALYFAFINYKSELLAIQEKELKITSESLSREIKMIKEVKNKTISDQQQTIAQQRQDLAEKNHLIAQLYDDTKEQNQKLIELTENLKKTNTPIESKLKPDRK